MSTVVKDLGPVTAYADAVAAGYTGTKEEWQALMASYASVAEEAQEAKEGAEAAQEAAESARDAAIDAKEGAEDAVDGFGAVVTQATNQAVQTVRAEGTTQVGNVSSEGTTQVNSVQAKGAEVLQSIPADYTELSNDVVQLKEDLTDRFLVRDSAITTKTVTITEGGFLRYTTGTVQSDANSKYTKFDVESGKRYYITTVISGNRGVCFYNGETLLKGLSATDIGNYPTDYELSLPVGCTVIGVSCLINSNLIVKSCDVKTLDMDDVLSVINEVHPIAQIATRNKSALQKGVGIVTTLNATIVEGKLLDKADGHIATNANSKYTKITVESDKKYYITTQISGDRGICFYDANDVFISSLSSDDVGYVLTDYDIDIPYGCATLGVSCVLADDLVIKSQQAEYIDVDDINTSLEHLTGDKTVLTVTTTDGYFVNANGNPVENASSKYVTVTGMTPETKAYFITCQISSNRAIVFKNAAGTVLGSITNSSGATYRDTLIDVPYGTATMLMSSLSSWNTRVLSQDKAYITANALDNPLMTFPYIAGALSYKPLGTLSKGYICITSDDGDAKLATKMIPLLLQKDVPGTFGLWWELNSPSAVLANDTYKATVLDAVNNHGCEISQHGNRNWANQDGSYNYTEKELVEWLAGQKAYWDSIGVTVRSAICPSHYNNPMVLSVMGGTFGVVRTGYNYSPLNNHYGQFYCSGPRSNMYGLSALNTKDYTLANYQGAIDYAIANHMIFIMYIHEWDMTDAQFDVLASAIDYAKTTDIEFCTLGEIPYLL